MIFTISQEIGHNVRIKIIEVLIMDKSRLHVGQCFLNNSALHFFPCSFLCRGTEDGRWHAQQASVTPAGMTFHSGVFCEWLNHCLISAILKNMSKQQWFKQAFDHHLSLRPVCKTQEAFVWKTNFLPAENQVFFPLQGLCFRGMRH